MEPGVFYLQDVDVPEDHGYDDPRFFIPNDDEYGDMIQES
jgi:hypothetical protein